MKYITGKITKLKSALLLLTIVLSGVLTTLSFSTVYAATCDPDDYSIVNGANCAHSPDTPEEISGTDGVFTTIVNVMLFIVGAIAVIMLIIGGIRYTTSNGDQGAVKAAKDTILYAIIGIIVAILAYAIVNFVIKSFTTP